MIYVNPQDMFRHVFYDGVGLLQCCLGLTGIYKASLQMVQEMLSHKMTVHSYLHGKKVICF